MYMYELFSYMYAYLPYYPLLSPSPPLCSSSTAVIPVDIFCYHPLCVCVCIRARMHAHTYVPMSFIGAFRSRGVYRNMWFRR